MPGTITVTVDVPRPRDVVWEELANLEAHIEWMADAERIEFLTEQRAGAGTRMAVATRFGPLRTNDVMEFATWDPPRRMAVRHQGLFTGTGEFRLDSLETTTTRVVWEEEVRFPWFFAGRLGAWLSRPVFRWVWRRNLRRLRERISSR